TILPDIINTNNTTSYFNAPGIGTFFLCSPVMSLSARHTLVLITHIHTNAHTHTHTQTDKNVMTPHLISCHDKFQYVLGIFFQFPDCGTRYEICIILLKHTQTHTHTHIHTHMHIDTHTLHMHHTHT